MSPAARSSGAATCRASSASSSACSTPTSGTAASTARGRSRPSCSSPTSSSPCAGGGELRFRGAADRIDVDDDGTLHVVDYKTGKADDYRGLDEDDPDLGGTLLQLPVYGAAARAHQKAPDAPVRAEYWFVSDRGKYVRVGYEITPDVLELVGATLGTIVDGIAAGRVPEPPDRQDDRHLRRLPALRPRRARRRRSASRVGAQAPRPGDGAVRATSPSRSTMTPTIPTATGGTDG